MISQSPQPETEQPQSTRGYPVSRRKFWLMNFLTLRSFAFYWAYRNFLALDKVPAKRPRMLAAINAAFLVFRFNYLLKLIEAEGRAKNVPVKFPRVFYWFCLLCVVPAVNYALIYFAVPYGLWIVVFLTTLILNQPNEALLKINQQVNPAAKIDTNFTKYNFVFITLVLAFTFLFPHDQLNIRTWLDERRAQLKTRWIYDDDLSKDEQNDKTWRIKAMDRFWQYFKTAVPDLYDRNRRMVAATVLDKDLESVNPLLYWTAEQSVDLQGKPVYEFAIFADNNPQLLPMLRAMIARAPKFTNVKYYCYRQPAAPNTVKKRLLGRTKFDLSAFKAHCHLTKENLIAVELTSPQFNTEPDENQAIAGQILVETILGQEAMFSWVGPITLKNGPVSVSLESAARELKSDFDLLKNVAQSKLPDKYYYEMSQEEVEKYVRLENDESDSSVSTTPNLTLAAGKIPFSSGRFSKKGELFVVFTTNTNIESESTPEMFISEVDRQLFDQKNGRTFWFSNTDGKLSALLCVNDFRKAAKVLREACDRQHFTHQSWLLFLDSELNGESVGLYPDTMKSE